MQRFILIPIVLALIVVSTLTTPVEARTTLAPGDNGNYQAIEKIPYARGVKISLSYDGLVYGCKRDPRTGAALNNWDYKYWINAYASYDPSRFRIWSDNFYIRLRMSDTYQGYDLLTRKPYLCVGIRSGVLADFTAAYVWVQ